MAEYTHPGTGQSLAVVIGAGGLGLAVASRLASTYRIVLADIDAGRLERAVESLRAAGHDAAGFGCDVTDPAAVAALAEHSAAAGPVRALVHVVGLSPSMADGATILRVNLVGPTHVADSFAGLAQPGTAAIFVASLAGHLSVPGPALAAALDHPLADGFVTRVAGALEGSLTPENAYTWSKWALIRMCRRRAAAWGDRGARILSVSPGLVDSPQGARELQAQPRKKALLELTPLRRQGTMTEIADAIDFLLSDRASFISGTDLLVDGGVAAAVQERTGQFLFLNGMRSKCAPPTGRRLRDRTRAA